MERLIFLFSLKPIVFGLLGMIISGISFPLAGVIILRNDLIPLRYMLMHGVILGGTFAIAFSLPMVPVVAVLNVILVLIMMAVKGRSKTLSVASTSMMVLTMGLASLVSHLFDVPSKDTLELLWGSPFALTQSDLLMLTAIAAVLIIYCIFSFRSMSAIFFDSDVASSLGINVRFHSTIMVLITALVIALSMKVMGALLMDALVILPVLSVSRNSTSLKGVFIKSALTGLALSLAGYLLALLYNLPVSGSLSILAVAFYLLSFAINKVKNKTKK